MTEATGANYPWMEGIGPVLPVIVRAHLRFQPRLEEAAGRAVRGVAARRGGARHGAARRGVAWRRVAWRGEARRAFPTQIPVCCGPFCAGPFRRLRCLYTTVRLKRAGFVQHSKCPTMYMYSTRFLSQLKHLINLLL